MNVPQRSSTAPVAGDPTTDIGDTLNIERVWRGGIEFDRSDATLDVE